MNRVYNTVWCPSRGMWVVTSELVRKGGQRPRQIKKSVLVGLIAGLLMPLHPALADSYENKTLQNSSLTLDGTLGDRAKNTTINEGGELVVEGGAFATETIINSGGQLTLHGHSEQASINSGGKEIVFGGSYYSEVNDGGEQHLSGGIAVSAVINSGGTQVIQNGGTAHQNHITGGRQELFSGGSAAYNVIDNGGTQHVLSGGSASNTIINSGGQQIISGGGSAVGTQINDAGVQNVSGGGVEYTVINSGGQQNIFWGNVSGTTINDAGVQNVLGGDVLYTTINSGGQQIISPRANVTLSILNDGGVQTVLSGAVAEETIINSGGMLKVDEGAIGFMVTQNDGGAVVTNTRAELDGTNRNGYFSIAGGNANNILLENGGALHVMEHNSASSTTVNSGGTLRVDAGGTATAITQNDGAAVVTNTSAVLEGSNVNGSFSITGGKASNMLLEHGGRLDVLSGHTANNTTLNSNGEMHVSTGGSATDTAVNSGGTQTISGGSATSTTINDAGIQNVLSGGSATDTTVNSGGTQTISGGSATSTTINDAGIQNVLSGGIATDTTVNAGGVQNVLRDGEASVTTLSSGGMLKVDAGGTATAITQNDGGAVVTNTSAVLEGSNRNGSFGISGGGASNMLLESGGILEVYGRHDATDTWVGSGGALLLNSGSVLKGTTTVTQDGMLSGPEVNNQGHLYYLNNSAAEYSGNITGTGDLTVDGGSLTLTGSLSQNGGVFISSGGVLNMDNLQATADVTAQTGTILNLKNGSTLTGRILDDGTGGGEVTMTDSSVWNLSGDSVVGTLNMDGSTVKFHAGTVLPQAATTLTAGSLSGNGIFLMNTDIAAYSADLLNVTGNASGNFNLGIKNTGKEPVSVGAPLRVVHTGGGDAAFTLNGGKVDAGAWEYYLTREDTDWYLTPDIPEEPDKRQTTASTDAVLSMASAPAYIFNSELQNLRFRHGEIAQHTPAPGGVWGRYIGSDSRISGAAGSAYKLRQSGFETGADKVFDLGDSSLAVGTFFSYTDNSIKHARGGKSKVDSTGGGLYATWFDNDGYYVDGVLKYNRFNNELRTWMSDGTAVKGDYSQNGFGGSLEAGRTFSLNENTWAQPYVRTTAFRADAKDISLNNGMKADIGAAKSLQAEAGVNLGMTLDVGGKEVKPYLSAAVSHEFSDNNKVRINDSYDFRNDISGTTGKYGLGVSAQLTPNAGVWAEARYENGKHTESPVTASVGFRFNF